MKRTLWAWSFYHPSVMILRSRCDSRLAGVNQDSCDLWGLGEVRVVFCFLLGKTLPLSYMYLYPCKDH